MEKPRFLLPSLLAVALTAPSANAALLLYEGFNGYTNGATLDGLAPNGNTFGINTSGGATYSNGGSSNQPAGMTIDNPGGLSLGSLIVSGGAVDFTTATSVASVLTTQTINGNTLWGSYLVRLGSTSNSSAQGLDIRLNDTANSTAANAYFRSDADSRGSSGTGPAISYQNTMGTAGTTLAPGETYIIISKFTNVGLSDAGDATLWALSSTQFGNFVSGGQLESFLTTPGNVTSTAAATKPAGTTYNWNGAYFEIVSAGITGSVDEFRYGESLLDVTPVPEPSAALLLGAAAIVGAARRRR